MSVYEKISGFADEISQDFDQQLKTVTDLGMKYICIRSAEHKGIADYTPEEVRTVLLPKLRAAGVGVSSLGTAIGKVEVDDEEGFAKQLEQLETLCETAKLLDCSFIRMFSFLIPKDADADSYTDVVLDKLRQFIRIAEKHDIVLLHENEKGIYGDTGARCKLLFDRLACPHFKAAFDFANFVQCEQDTAECWELLHDQIAYIHIKDALPGCLLNVPAGTGLGIDCADGPFGPLTIIGGRIYMEDGKLVQTIDSRFPTCTNGEKLTAQVTAALGEGAKLEDVDAAEPFYIAADSPAIRACIDTYNEVTGENATPFTMGGGTYARHFPYAVSFGPEHSDMVLPEFGGPMHGANEAAPIDKLLEALKIYIIALLRLEEIDF